MPVIPEILVSVSSDRDEVTPGEILFVATEYKIKAKWSEILALGMRPSGTYFYIPKWVFQNGYKKYNDTFTYLQMYNNSADVITKNYGGISVPFIKVTPVDMSYVNYVKKGSISYIAYKKLKESWSSGLPSSYATASANGTLDQFYDDYIDSISVLRAGIGKDERGDADIIDTWPWGDGDLSIGFATRVSGMENEEYDDIIAGEDYINLDNINGEISEDTLNDIKNPNKKFAPRRNKGVKKGNLYKNAKIKKDKDEKENEE